VRVRPTGYTGLTAEDLFMFGNLAGETGDGGGGDAAFRVSALDVAAVKRALGWATPVTSAADFNRDGRTNALDLALVRRTLGHSLDTSGPGAGTLLTRRDGESDGVGEGVLSIC